LARTEFTPAVVLRSVPYGDADRVVTLLTESHGKIAVIARSARKSAKRFAGSLEPCALIEAEVAIGRGDVGRIAQARVIRAFPGILADLERISIAAAGLELVRESIAEREPDRSLLPAIVRFFEALEASPAKEEALLAFSLRVLAVIGSAPNLASCAVCDRRAPEGKAALFDPSARAIVCVSCGGGRIKIPGALRARMMRALGRSWDGEIETWPEKERGVARRVVDEVIARSLAREMSAGSMLAQVRELGGTSRD
jgi:DNA repair protein RecO (recombination protein O)